MGKNEVAVSLLDLERENAISKFYNLETAKVDYFHIDVMDGIFVPNNTEERMYEFSTTLANITTIKQDIHLMVKDVKKYVDLYSSFGRNRIAFHVEALDNNHDAIMDMINYIKDTGNQVGLALSPDTPIESLRPYLPYIHSIVVMTVIPGKGGQSIIEAAVDKIPQIKKIVDEMGNDIDIEVDGGVKLTNCERLRSLGANILISGSAIIKSDDMNEAVKVLRCTE